MNKKFILWPDKPEIRGNCLRHISELWVDVPYDVTITKHVNRKTAQQRNWFHALCDMLGEQLGMQGGEIQEIAKAKLFGWKQVQLGGVTLTIADGHSEDCNAIKYGELIETVYMLAGESGTSLPEANKWR